MPRYLVVANLTLGGEHLLEVLKDRAGKGDARVHVLVPASSPPEGWHTHDMEHDIAEAQNRLSEAITAFGALNAKEVTGEVGSSRPFDAIGDCLRANATDLFDEIILSTLPVGPSKWIAMDLPARVARNYDIPLTHVEAAEA